MNLVAPVPLIDHVDWIVSLDGDAARRNLLITQCYHELSAALAPLVSPADANWCTFATWASLTAGSFIRQEEVSGVARLVLGRSRPVHVTLRGVRDVLSRLDAERGDHDDDLIDLADAIVHHVAEVIAAGNLTVFGELAPLFARAIAAWTSAGESDLDALVAGLTPGPSTNGGQDLLRAAFGHYAAARVESDPRRKAALMLLANAEIGLHEQTRLQPFIAASIDAPVYEMVVDVVGDMDGGSLICCIPWPTSCCASGRRSAPGS